MQKTTLCAPSAKAAQAAGVRNRWLLGKKEDDPGASGYNYTIIGLGTSHRALRVGFFLNSYPDPMNGAGPDTR